MAKEYLDELDYYASRIAKLRNKKYEYYVVTRIIHLLNDPEIEFRTQQFVKVGDSHKLIDLYFPQFKIAVEIDELGHLGMEHKDKIREKEIYEVIQSNFHRVSVNENRSLVAMNLRIQEIIDEIRQAKKIQEESGTFKKFEFNAFYDVDAWLELGELSVHDNARFRKHTDALRLVGKNYRGHQSATATLAHPKGTQDATHEFIAWFPKLYANKNWNNQLVNDGKRIEARTTDQSPYVYRTHEDTFVVFSHYRDELNQTYYKFQGVFDAVPEESNENILVYNRVADKIYFADGEWWF